MKKKAKRLRAALAVDSADAIKNISLIVKAAGVILDVVDMVEARCMAVDGPVTPTCSAIREGEMRVLWRAARVIAHAKLPKIVEWVTTADPLAAHVFDPREVIDHVPLRFRCILPPLPKPESRRARIARVVRRRKARRKSK